MKNIILCADDYGQDRTISAGIRQLLDQQRLTATSCMVTSPDWPEQAALLKPYIGQIDIGLHFNLSHGPESANLAKLMRQAFLRQLPAEAIQQQLHDQLQCFKQALAIEPNFIDGHQHVHVLPIVRDSLLTVYARHFPDKTAYIRVPAYPVTSSKAMVIMLSGAGVLRRRLTALNIPHNASFSGIYNFTDSAHYATLFPSFGKHIRNNGLIMCHPGLTSNNQDDPIAANRFKEWQYFSSQAFLDDCARHQWQLSRFDFSENET